MSWTETTHADAGAMAAAVAERLAAACREAIAARGRAWLALAGGRTPLPIYRRLADLDLNWPAVDVLPTDERWVAHGDSACNLRALRAAFGAAGGIRLHPLTPPDPGPQPDTAAARASLAAADRAFDAVLLGMGGDGHFASLFPGTPAGSSADDCCIVEPDPLPAEAPYARISLSLARLLRARRLFLTMTGSEKLAVLRQAQRSGADAGQLPIAALLHAGAPEVEIHWSH